MSTFSNNELHDLRAALRFLTHLVEEIKIAEHIQDIKEEHIIKKFEESCAILKRHFASVNIIDGENTL